MTTRRPPTADPSADLTALSIARPQRVGIPRAVLAAFVAAGVEVDVIAAELGVDAHARVTPTEADRLLTRCLADVGDPAFALRVCGRLRPELFDVVGYAILAAPTFGEALRRVSRYIRVLGGGLFEMVPCTVVTRIGSPVAAVAARRWSFADADPVVERAHVDFDLALLATLGRVGDASILPLAAGLRGPAPSYAHVYAEVLGVQPQFDAAYDELVIASDDLQRPLVRQTPELDAFFVERAERMLAECDIAPLVDRVRTAVARTLAGDAPTVETVARTLGTSERSLQRQLAAAGTCFADEVDSVRRSAVLGWLAASDISLPELAYRSGFSGTGPLHRAVRRWVGMTPLQYRLEARCRER